MVHCSQQIVHVVVRRLFWSTTPSRESDDRDHRHRGPGQVRLNLIQVLGTHNSYHVHAGPSLFSLLRNFSPALADSLDYGQLPLDQQLSDQGIRQFELDVFTDPAGGLYSDPAGPRIVAQSGLPPDLPPNDPNAV